MSDTLRSIIESAQSEQDPIEVDNLEDGETALDEDLLNDEDLGDEELDEEELEDEVLEDEEPEEKVETDGKKYTVKVDGEEFKVSEDELKAGYQRQADYTREKQALKADIESFEAEKESVKDQLTSLQVLESAWEQNPIDVISNFVTTTGNPTQAITLLIQDLAAQNALDPQFLSIFGITPQIQTEWAKEQELNKLRQQANQNQNQQNTQLSQAQEELEIQRAIAEYDRQIDEIIDGEGYDFTVKQRNEFRTELAKYAADNDLTNLKAAYKAFKYEESVSKKKIAEKTVERAKAKKQNNAVSKRSDSSGFKSDSSTKDLNSIIKDAMREAQSN
jgi:hypothetical protein